MSVPEITTYQKVHVYLNKKFSILSAKLKASKDYKALEKFTFVFFLDGFLISLATMYFIPFSFFTLISFGAGAFLIKRILPSIVQILNSINLIRIGK